MSHKDVNQPQAFVGNVTVAACGCDFEAKDPLRDKYGLLNISMLLHSTQPVVYNEVPGHHSSLHTTLLKARTSAQ